MVFSKVLVSLPTHISSKSFFNGTRIAKYTSVYSRSIASTDITTKIAVLTKPIDQSNVISLSSSVTKKYYDIQQHLWYQQQQYDDLSIDRSYVGNIKTSLLLNQHDKLNNKRNNDTTIIKVQMGITEYGLSHLGDIISISTLDPPPPPPTTIQNDKFNGNNIDSTNNNTILDYRDVLAGEPFVLLYWEGYTQTYADELYHTVWESIEGSKVINSLVSGKLLLQSMPDPQKEDIDEDTIVAEILCTTDDWNYFLQKYTTQHLLRSTWSSERHTTNIHNSVGNIIVDDEQIYKSIVQQLPPGKFTL